jgi:DNA-binding MarR family transcriptional regulator
VLEVIESMMATSGGIAPTMAELGARLGTTYQNAHYHVTSLVRKGYIEITRPNEARSIEIIRDPDQDAA